MRYTPIANDLFVNNRKRLVKELKPGSLAVLNANDIMPTTADGTLSFRQNSDLFYLTGVNQEESMLVICPDFPEKRFREILFVREPNELLEKWEGHKLSREEARAVSGIDTVLWLSDFHKWFHHMMAMGGVEHVYLNTNEHYRADVVVETRDARFISWCKEKYPLHNYQRLAPLMAALRTIKQPAEIELMQKAVDITGKAFLRVLKFLKPGVYENEVEAEYIHEFVRNGSRGHAYNPIIASGVNNTVLHYIENSRPCKAGDLLLIDAAAEYGNYNADLTRTIPVSGKFTKRQKEVYNAVLRVHQEAIKLMSSHLVYFDYHREVEKIMERELLGLKLISRDDIRRQRPGQEAFRKYYYHGTSHMLGLDVHDVGNMHAKMAIGSLWTVEPGIYIKEEGFGVRLENNVVILKKGVLDLTRNIPIEADEIESIMNTKK
ncbi:MAG: aminopeptidase P family protein [Cyclobacteriaceae bacterium]|jgi:Xaa-Pro aminopeptidase|nr:X-Pro aminopeptidase [Cytophagales bacterium]HNP76538.1 aminopeptidase P family protein [Cyclobacteriaceae bacterium]